MDIVTRAKAIELGLPHYFTGRPCKHGHFAKRNTTFRYCTECDLHAKNSKKYTTAEDRKNYAGVMYYKHREKILTQKKTYRQNNKGKVNALVSARKKVVRQRTPAWLSDFDKLKIKCMYQIAAMLTRENNEPWHVDHIIPLQGKLVSGLHVPANLQVMRGSENVRKKNKFEVVV